MTDVVLRETVLRDGTHATVMPARIEDRELLREGYEHLSSESQFHRFLTPVPHLTDEMMHRLVDGIDWIDHVALVLAVQPEGQPEQKVAVARIIRYPNHPTDADVAVTVMDEWQGRGIAGVLLADLMRLRPPGLLRLVTEVADDNPAALAMLSRLGDLTATSTERGSYRVEVSLPPRPDIDDLEALAQRASSHPVAKDARAADRPSSTPAEKYSSSKNK